MLHPSYTELMKIINKGSEDDTPVVNSRYSIVMATAKRARQIIAGEANVSEKGAKKPLSTAVEELKTGDIKILPEMPGAADLDEINTAPNKYLGDMSASSDDIEDPRMKVEAEENYYDEAGNPVDAVEFADDFIMDFDDDDGSRA
jgi:DNA-directed RNA polymerase subunit omega